MRCASKLIQYVTDIAEDRLDSLLKSLNKDTPLINDNLNESNSAGITSKTDGKVFNLIIFYVKYMFK